MGQQKNDNQGWLEDVAEREKACIALRAKGVVVYLYPFDYEIARKKVKVMTRDGRTLRHISLKDAEGNPRVHGEIDGEPYDWDAAGRFNGPYRNSPMDLFIPERYFRVNYLEESELNNAEWAKAYGRPHPGVEVSGHVESSREEKRKLAELGKK